MTHETIPTAYVPTKEVNIERYNNRWKKLQQEEEEWSERLYKGVPIEEYRQHEEREKYPRHI
jgi:hypothetical protein